MVASCKIRFAGGFLLLICLLFNILYKFVE